VLEQLTGKTERWRVKLYRHAEVGLWTPHQGEAITVEVFGHKTDQRRNQHIEWVTELVSWVTPDMLAENALDLKEYPSFLASIQAVMSKQLTIPVQAIPINRVER
jgi:hypothetical protein